MTRDQTWSILENAKEHVPTAKKKNNNTNYSKSVIQLPSILFECAVIWKQDINAFQDKTTQEAELKLKYLLNAAGLSMCS